MSEHLNPDPAPIVQRIVNAWDCCGTCAGGVLAEYVREERAKVLREAAGRVDAAMQERLLAYMGSPFLPVAIEAMSALISALAEPDPADRIARQEGEHE